MSLEFAYAHKFRLASSFSSRARGLLYGGEKEELLVIAPCSDIHTFGMKVPIDVAFVNDKGVVVSSHREVCPWHRLRKKGAVAVIERFADKAPWFEPGDALSLGVVRKSDKEEGKDEGMSYLQS